MTDQQSFLQRHTIRADSHALSQSIVFGYIVSLAITLLSLYKHYFVLGAADELWRIGRWIGAAGFVITIAIPWIWDILSKGLVKVGSVVGHFVLGYLVLIPIYYLLFWPVGLLLKKKRGSGGIVAWSEGENPPIIGWQKKQIKPVSINQLAGHQGKKTGFRDVLSFFIENGLYFFIPVLILLLALGIVLFFLQTSVIAPFIYTLF